MAPVARPAGDVLIRRSPANLWRSGDFGVVVLGPTAEEPVALEGTGVAVWEALAVPCSFDQLVERLATAYGADAADVASDVEPLLERLNALGVVEVDA